MNKLCKFFDKLERLLSGSTFKRTFIVGMVGYGSYLLYKDQPFVFKMHNALI